MQTSIDIKSPMEARFLRIFRALAAIRVLLALLFLLLPGDQLRTLPWMRVLTVLEALLLLVYLSLPALRVRLGRYYLPVAIGWATMIPLLVQSLTLYGMFGDVNIPAIMDTPQIASIRNTLVLAIINQTILVLLVPLIVVAWLYARSTMILYCVAIFVFDLVIAVLLFHSNPALFLLLFALMIFRTMLYAVIGLMINQIAGIQMEQQRRLIAANETLQEYGLIREQLATSRERTRLARELHDTLAHTLSAATVQLEAVSIIWEQQPEKAQQMVIKSAAMMRDGLAETRRALQALRAGSLDHENLMDAISALAESLMTRYSTHIEVQANVPIAIDDPAVEHGLYRIVQEATFNAARHAGAKRIMIRLDVSPHQLVISVNDDGCGFNPEGVATTDHFGLRGMRERARQIGADLQISSQIGNGTSVNIRLSGKDGYDAPHHLR
jgi:signal transduction histidine kinase